MFKPCPVRALLLALISTFVAAGDPAAAAPPPSTRTSQNTPDHTIAWVGIDYSTPNSWLAQPGQPSAASLTPRESPFRSHEATAVADAFYIHPTTSMRADQRNADLMDPVADKTSSLMLLTQATAFNGLARIFAPKYRQITLPTYDLDEAAVQEPLDKAYADVRDAFDYYIAHENHGRPFFLVGHSQGSSHGLRLLGERIQGTPLASLLVAAYFPGQATPEAVFQNDLKGIPPCIRPEQITCVALWGTFAEGTQADIDAWEAGALYWSQAGKRWTSPRNQPLVNINPVSWSKLAPFTSLRQHLGAIPFGTQTTFKRILPHLLAVRDAGRYIHVSPTPLPAGYFDDGNVFGASNYHVFDIALFWLDIRKNARQRLDAWLAKSEHSPGAPE